MSASNYESDSEDEETKEDRAFINNDPIEASNDNDDLDDGTFHRRHDQETLASSPSSFSTSSQIDMLSTNNNDAANIRFCNDTSSSSAATGKKVVGGTFSLYA